MILKNNHIVVRRSMLLPLYGCLLFTALYLLAARYYPGGSPVDHSSKGFDWFHNYWCNLLAERSIDGANNKGRPFAFAGMIVLCLSLSIFWIQYAHTSSFSSPAKRIMIFAGVGSMCISFFLFTRWHDAVINVAGLLGLVALSGVLFSLYQRHWLLLFYWGLINLGLIGLNNFLYYQNNFFYLAFVQKISFLSFLFWISLICLRQNKTAKAN